MMKKIFSLLQLGFLPKSPDFALLALRLWLGITLIRVHGWSKFIGFSQTASKFPDPLGIGSEGSLALVVFAEVFCAGAVALGLFTRLSSLVLAINFGVAFGMIHNAVLKPGSGSGELAFLYLAGFVVLWIGGPGRFSLDAAFGERRKERL